MRTWRILLTLCGAQVAIIAAILLHARALQNETTRITSRLRAESKPSDLSARIVLLEGENERIRKDLATIPLLREESKRIESEIAAESAQEIALWTAGTNEIQAATEQTRQRIAEIERWEANYNRMQLQKRAAERLAELTSQKSDHDASDQYRGLEGNLKQIAERMNRQLAVRRDWTAMEKTIENRDAYRSRIGEAWTNLDAAMKQLGKNIDLFEELPVKPEDADSKTPFLRTLLPDQQGVTATLYLDGTVIWSSTGAEVIK